jgi:hypothetical protein
LSTLGRREGEDPDSILGDLDGVLELDRQRAVARDRGPAVGQHLQTPGPRSVWAVGEVPEAAGNRYSWRSGELRG